MQWEKNKLLKFIFFLLFNPCNEEIAHLSDNESHAEEEDNDGGEIYENE